MSRSLRSFPASLLDKIARDRVASGPTGLSYFGALDYLRRKKRGSSDSQPTDDEPKGKDNN